MKRISILYFLFLTITAYSQENEGCDRLFHRYNPKYTSLRTSSLIISGLSERCNFSSIIPEGNIALSRSSFQNNRTPDRGLITQDARTRNLATVRAYVEAAKHKEKAVNEYADSRKSTYFERAFTGYAIGTGAGLLLSGVCDGFTLGGCTPLNGAIIGTAAGIGGTYIGDGLAGTNDNAVEEDRRIEQETNIKTLRDDLELDGFDTESCKDVDCVSKAYYAREERNHQTRQIIAAETKPVLDRLDGVENAVARTQEEVRRTRQTVINQGRKTRELLEMQFVKQMTAANNLSMDIEEIANQLGEFQNETRESHRAMNESLNRLLANDQAIFGELDKHTELLEQNAVDNVLITDILLGQLPPGQQASIYTACLNNKELCPSSLKEILKRDGGRGVLIEEEGKLRKKAERNEKIRKTNEFIKTVNQIQQGLALGVDIAAKLGLSGSEQEKVAKIIHYANAAASIGIGLAKIKAGEDVFGGIMATLSGVNSLFGNAEPEPSDEIKEIRALRDEMRQRLEIVDEKLDTIISRQIVLYRDLSANIKANREIMQYRFNGIDYRLEEIVNNQEIIQSQLRQLLDDKLNSCENILGNPNTPNFEKYQDFLTVYGDSGGQCQNCLDGIRDWLNGSGLARYNIQPGENTAIKREYETYKKVATFFEWYYEINQNNIDYALQLLLVPSGIISNNNQEYCDFFNKNIDFELLKNEVVNPSLYIDAYAFRDFVSIYSVFYPYFEFHQGLTYQPLPVEEYIEFTGNETNIASLLFRKGEIDKDIKRLNHIDDIIRAQQALMSGHLLLQPFYQILYQNQYNNNINFGINLNPKQLVIDILNSNPIIAQNFATYVIRKNYRINEKIYKDSTQIDDQPINANYNEFVNYAYANTNPRVFIPGIDSFYVDTMITLGIDTARLEKASYIDTLKFVKDDYLNIAYLKIGLSSECDESPDIVCQTSIPVPEIGNITTDEFRFTYAYHYGKETSFFLNELTREILFPNELRDNWMELTQTKLAILNSQK